MEDAASNQQQLRSVGGSVGWVGWEGRLRKSVGWSVC